MQQLTETKTLYNIHTLTQARKINMHLLYIIIIPNVYLQFRPQHMPALHAMYSSCSLYISLSKV